MTPGRPARWAVVALACGVVAACGTTAKATSHISTPTTVAWPSSPVPRGSSPAPAGKAAAPAAGYIPSAATLVLKAEDDALSQGWAHIDVTTSGGGHYAVYSQDSGPAVGHQTFTVDGAQAEAIVVGGVVYARGDAAAVTTIFGLPASEEWHLANQWISFSGDDAGYSGISSGVTLRSALGQLTLGGALQVGAPTVVDGVPAVPITGTVTSAGGSAPGTGTLYITPGSGTLPVELDVRGADGTTSRVRYSHWGVPAQLSAPAAAIPASSVAPSASG